jgi:hypothetical protein
MQIEQLIVTLAVHVRLMPISCWRDILHVKWISWRASQYFRKGGTEMERIALIDQT